MQQVYVDKEAIGLSSAASYLIIYVQATSGRISLPCAHDQYLHGDQVIQCYCCTKFNFIHS